MNENSNKIKIKIITHEKVVFEENVDELYVKTTDGALGILPNHVPVVCALDIGVTRVIKDKEPICITTMGGVLQFSENEATILTDIAECGDDIDVVRAKEALNAEDAEVANEIVKVIYYDIKPMTPEDAKLKLQEQPQNKFLAFIDIDTGRTNVIYRLKDNKNFGLVEPEG